MKNAANLIIDGANNSTSTNETIEKTKQALGLADQHIVIALSTLNEVKDKLGLTKNKTIYYFKIKMIAIHNLYVYNVLLIYNQCVYKFYNSDEPFRRRSIDLPTGQKLLYQL